MTAFHMANLALLDMLAAGNAPSPAVLMTACLFALWGSVMCIAVVGWTGWRHAAQRRYIAIALVAAAGAALVSHAVASHFYVPRPFVAGVARAYIAHAATGSLPSTHATVMFFVGFAFLCRPPLRGAAVVLCVLAAVTGWARIYTGVHYPADIAAGALLAALLCSVWVAGWKIAGTWHRAALASPTPSVGSAP